MAPESSDPWLASVVLILAIASVGTWFWLVDRLKSGPILAYEPRRPVPWSGIWAILPILFVALALIGLFYGDGFSDESQPATAADSIERLALGTAQQLFFVGMFLVAAVASTRATRADLGLPQSAAELAGDVRIGVVAWLAALVPVYGAQVLLVSLLGMPKGHPILQMLEDEASPTLFALAFVTAVVVAPVCEEIAFRLLLQGWLEKWEDARLRGSSELHPAASVIDDALTAEADQCGNDEARMTNDGPAATEHSSFSTDQPPARGLGGLPYGWLPIAVSSFLFGLAHVGYGPDPIPLFLLALVLGYTYQRTHRIVPSIVTHALFNGMSLFALWRITSLSGP